jgi:hypothetical protein
MPTTTATSSDNNNPTAGMYWDFHIPLGLHDLVEDLKSRQPNNPNAPEIVTPPANREWLSQPRISTDSTTEVITVQFKLPVSIGEISWQTLRVSVHVEVWYQDRSNTWMQMVNQDAIPITLELSSSATSSWYTNHTFVYPIVAKAVQFRFTRRPDPSVGNNPYSVGMREGLIRRNIYNRAQGMQALESQQDPIGNVINQYVKDWDASKAIDNSATTYWRCAPQPDPNAVVNLYLDCRDVFGNPQIIDKVYLDPVYSGNALNLYYSNDPTQATLKLSPISLIPNQTENVTWIAGQGIWDNTPLLGLDTDNALYSFPVSWGPLVSQNVWIGIEWTPEFNPASGPSLNPVLFEVTPTNTSGTQYWPKIWYDVGASAIRLSMYNGTTTHQYTVTLSPLFQPYTPLKIVVGWTYPSNPVTGTPTIYMDVDNQYGHDLGTLLTADANFPTHVTLDGSNGFANWMGYLSAVVVKLDSYATDSTYFQQNPTIYVNPNPVLPNASGNIPSTTLDNAILACDWTTMQYICGGTHESWYTAKEWTPIWRNYVAEQGYLMFPQSISLSYLNLEFSQLTPESYPVYDQGIKTQYQVFPITVTATAIQKNPNFFGMISGLLTLGSDLVLGQPQTVNWLNPRTVSAAINSAFGLVQATANVSVGSGYTTNSLPNTAVSTSSQVVMTTRQEVSNPYIYRRTPMNAQTLAQTAYHKMTREEVSQGNPSVTDPSQQAITNATTPSPVVITQPSATGIQGQDWYVFPGQTLKMPASIINGLTDHEVECRRDRDSTMRIRYTTTAVHQYTTNTVTLDAAIAYFAGIREVQPYKTTYVASEDPVSFNFTTYDPTQWVFHNINKLSSGPITAKSNPYVIMNSDFDLSLAYWTPVGAWSWSNAQGAFTGPGSSLTPGIPDFSYGSATVVANGTNLTLTSAPIPVSPLDVINVSAWIVFQNLILSGSATQGGIYVDAVGYGIDGVTVVNSSIPLGPTMALSVWTVRAASTANISLTAPGTTLDGVTLVNGNLIFLKNQTVMSQNGVYQFNGPATPLTLKAKPLLVTTVTSGTLNAGTTWTLTPAYVGDPGNSSIPEFGVTANHLYGTFTVPTGVYNIGLRGRVANTITGGQVWLDDFEMEPFAGLDGTVFNDLITSSTFAKVEVEVQDSGLVRSDGMWAQEDPFDTNISHLALAFYTTTIPSIIPGGMWGDTFADWADMNTDWGDPRAVVSIQVDPNMVFDGKRVIHFSRAAGAGEAGIQVRQQTFFVPGGLFRIGAVWYKPTADNNTITVALRRVSDGVFIYEETINTPVVGYWYNYQSSFIEIPSTQDQVYTVELIVTGDQADDLYLNDLYSEVAQIRYFCRVGDSSQFLHDITPLVYGDNCVVSTTAPVNEFSVQAEFLSDQAFAYSSNFTPIYLK